MGLARQRRMWLEAILTNADLRTALRQFSPLTIRLGDNGSLLLAEPTEVSVIPDVGISVVCDATVHWPLLGFDVPLAFKGLTVRVIPVVDTAVSGSPLVFRLQMDHAGVAILPALFDHRITKMVNEELEKKHVELSWNFIETLSHEFELPAAVASAASISLVATAGMVKANEAALGLAVRFETTVRRRSDVREGPVHIPDAPNAPVISNLTSQVGHGPAPSDAFDARAFLVGASVATMAFTVFGGLARLLRRTHRSW